MDPTKIDKATNRPGSTEHQPGAVILPGPNDSLAITRPGEVVTNTKNDIRAKQGLPPEYIVTPGISKASNEQVSDLDQTQLSTPKGVNDVINLAVQDAKQTKLEPEHTASAAQLVKSSEPTKKPPTPIAVGNIKKFANFRWRNVVSLVLGLAFGGLAYFLYTGGYIPYLDGTKAPGTVVYGQGDVANNNSGTTVRFTASDDKSYSFTPKLLGHHSYFEGDKVTVVYSTKNPQTSAKTLPDQLNVYVAYGAAGVGLILIIYGLVKLLKPLIKRPDSILNAPKKDNTGPTQIQPKPPTAPSGPAV